MTEDRIIEKIRKLLALATSSNEHEAAAAAAKAQELLLKHKLDISQIEEEEEEEVTMVDYDERVPSGWRTQLVYGIAQATGCALVVESVWKWEEAKSRSLRYKRYHLIGRPESVEVVAYLYGYLEREIVRLSPMRKGSLSREIDAFRWGATTTITRRLEAEYTEFQEATDQTMALVKVENALVEAKKAELFLKLGKSRGGGWSDGAAFRAGAEAGKNVALRRGVGEGRNAGGQHLLS